MVRILIADDHEIIRETLKALLSRRPDWQVCGEAANGHEAVELAQRLNPDIAVLDLGMPGLNGFEATVQIRKALPKTEVLIFTMHESDDLAREVLAAGARGYVLKSDATTHIEAAVEALAQHKTYFSPAASAVLLAAAAIRPAPAAASGSSQAQLSAREREIVRLLAEGHSNKELARLLDLSVATVQTHRANIMRKLGVDSLAAVVRYAVRNKIIEA